MKNQVSVSKKQKEKTPYGWIIPALITVSVIAVAALVIYIAVLSGRTDVHDFTIEDGVITDYSGSGKKVTIPEGVVVIGERAFWRHEEIEKLVLPASLTTIRNGAFYGCSSLEDIRFSGALNFIGDAAFGECLKLESFTVPASVQYVHSEAFYGDENLRAVEVAEGSEAYKSENGVLYSADGKTLICYPAGKTEEHFDLPGSVEAIAAGAFETNSHLKTVDLGSVIEIGERAFQYCLSLEAVKLPATVRTVYTGAFESCAALSDLQFEEGVETLGFSAFEGCGELERVELPESLTEIGRVCFGSCPKLTYVSIPAGLQGIYDTAFEESENVTIYGYAGSPAEQYAEYYEIPFVALEE